MRKTDDSRVIFHGAYLVTTGTLLGLILVNVVTNVAKRLQLVFDP